MENNAIEQSLVDIAVGGNERQTFEEGVDAEPDDKATQRLVRCGLFVVMSMLGAMGELFKQELDKVADEDSGSNLEMDARGDEPVLTFAKEHVWDEVDEAGGHEEGSAEDVDIVEGLGREPLARRKQGYPNEDTDDDEGV